MPAVSFKSLSINTYTTASCGARVFGGISGSIARSDNKDYLYVGLLHKVIFSESRAIWATFDALTEDAFWSSVDVTGRAGGHAGRVDSSCSIEEMMNTCKRLFPDYIWCGEELSAQNPNTRNPIAAYVVRTSLPDEDALRRDGRTAERTQLATVLSEWLRENAPPAPQTLEASDLLQQLLEAAGEL